VTGLRGEYVARKQRTYRAKYGKNKRSGCLVLVRVERHPLPHGYRDGMLNQEKQRGVQDNKREVRSDEADQLPADPLPALKVRRRVTSRERLVASLFHVCGWVRDGRRSCVEMVHMKTAQSGERWT
jgi:hypothetical protein